MGLLFITQQELSVLVGLPYIQQSTYLLGIRPHMDRSTCVVGLKRSISYQSISKILHTDPYPGVQSESPSRQQIRRVIKNLERVGLIEIQSEDKHLILKCVLANSNDSVQNKADIEVDTQPDTSVYRENPITTRVVASQFQKADTEANTKADTPLYISNNYYIYLLQQFEKFWTNYPLKKSRQNAWLKFQSLQPSEELLARIFTALEEQIAFYNQIKSQGQWIPDWKYPANWLAQHCWEDEINFNLTQEISHANHQRSHSNQQSVDPFWDSCKNGIENTPETNVIDFSQRRKT